LAALKKILKVLLIAFAVIAVIIAAVVFYQWDNINAVISGLKETPEQITQKREENNNELVEKVNEYIEGELREPTEEEKELISSGEMTIAEVYSKILSENNSTIVEYDAEKEKFVEKEKESSELPPQEEKPSRKKQAEDIVNKYISQLYALESAYTAKAEGMISSGANYYEKLKKSGQDKATARANTISYFTGPVRSAIADCDSKVETIIKKLEAELKKIGAETSIVETVRKTYASEKKLKLAYYSNKYLK